MFIVNFIFTTTFPLRPYFDVIILTGAPYSFLLSGAIFKSSPLAASTRLHWFPLLYHFTIDFTCTWNPVHHLIIYAEFGWVNTLCFYMAACRILQKILFTTSAPPPLLRMFTLFHFVIVLSILFLDVNHIVGSLVDENRCKQTMLSFKFGCFLQVNI